MAIAFIICIKIYSVRQFQNVQSGARSRRAEASNRRHTLRISRIGRRGSTRRLRSRGRFDIASCIKGFPLKIRPQPNETIVIRGIIVPAGWSANGQIICVAVATFDEKEYRIAENDAIEQWRYDLNKAVEIQGRPYKRGIEQWLAIHAFHFIETVSQTGAKGAEKEP
jgi:hypothetical protein